MRLRPSLLTASWGLLGVALALVVGSQSSAGAATFAVDSADDQVDASPGDGLCAAASGGCTLRAAVQEANALAGPDTILLPAGTYVLRIFGRGEDASLKGDLDVTDDVTIVGAGARNTVIKGAMDDGMISVWDAASVSISGVTVTRGFGGFFGGVFNAGTLTLTDVVVTGNHAESPATGGGGLYNIGAATLVRVTMTHNRADSMTSAGIVNFGTVTVEDSTVSRNRGAVGGIFSLGTVSLERSTISRNAGHAIGGLYVLGGEADLTNVTLSGNGADGRSMDASDPPPTAGIAIEATATAVLTNATVANGRGVPGVYGVTKRGGTFVLTNTLVSSRMSGINCFDSPMLSGPFTSAGHNLDTDGSCLLAGSGDRSGTTGSPIDPRLGPLARHGGPTLTHALRRGSPAVDAGDDAACPTTDQRGAPRPADGDADGVATCDIGAYELQP